ncbi:MAG: PKD domain-containing protein [Nanoarchaeota archaeon]
MRADKKGVISLDFMNFNRGLFLLLINLLIAIFVLATLTIFIPTISASFLPLGNPNSSINGIYGPSENITGWINISFSSEPGNSIFSDTRGNSINLSEILKRNIGYSYSCNPADCGGDYLASNANSVKTATLAPGESKLYGIRLTGNISGINSLKFNLESNAPASCTNQIEVDFLDDFREDARNAKALDSASCSSSRNYGCFDLNKPTEESIIGGTSYCERINLSNSPGFTIGAWVRNVSGLRTINAAILNTNSEEVATCTLPSASSAGGEISCNVDYSVIEPEEHYVCIYSTSGSGVYRTRGYSDPEGCGYYGTSIPTITPAAYQIFAQGKSFNSVGTLNINKSMVDGRDLGEIAYEYLRRRNPTISCYSGCVIPIKITSNANQDITLKNLEVEYQKESGIVVENNFYDVAKTFAKVTAGFQKLYLDYSGFSVPATLGNYSFSLKLNSQNLISKIVVVKDVPIINSVTPIKTASAYPTEFTVNVDSNYNLTRFSWDFGDNTAEIITQGNKASHVYSSIGAYNLRVKVTDQRNLNASEVFVINVSSPKDLINASLDSMEKDLSNLKRQLSSFSLFDQKILNSSLDLGYLQERINSLKIQYENAASEQEYNDIVSELLGLRIPESISKSGSAEGITLLSKTDNVNPDIIQELSGGTYDSEKREGYIDAVTFWNLENLETKFDFTEFSGRYEEGIEPIIRVFEISSSEKKDIGYDYYLIMPEPEGFDTDAEFESASGYVYINLKDESPFSFSTTEDIDFTNLEAFVSPAISRLSVTEETLPPEETGNKKWVVFILVILFLLALGVIFYMIMRAWYKKKYEHYLFKNRNDLYNMINYINIARKKGLKHNEIEKKLKGAGWSSERITYVMKKYFGKRM